MVRSFRVLHQVLCISSVNFERQSFVGYTEIAIAPLRQDLSTVCLNCGPQCNVRSVTVCDAYDAEFEIRHPLKHIAKDEKVLRDFAVRHAATARMVDADLGNGELKIFLPRDVSDLVNELKILRIGIEFDVEKPQTGLRFVSYNETSQKERATHFFTVRDDEPNSRAWFPCVDTWSEPCTWKIEITVENQLTAVSSGELLETYFTPDMRRKTYHYRVKIPTAAPNIGLAVGHFEIAVHPEMQEMTLFCLPGLMPLMMHSMAQLHKVFEFFEELLSSRYPYTTYKHVFVDMSDKTFSAYSSVGIMNTSLLYDKRIIDQSPITRQELALCVAQEFFTCYIGAYSWEDLWLVKGISLFITSLWVQRMYGNNEHLYQIYKEMKDVVEFESQWGGIVLRPRGGGNDDENSFDANANENHHFFAENPFTSSPLYVEMLGKKGFLVMRMIEKKLGKDMMCQVFNKLLSLAGQGAMQKFTPANWANMLLSTNSFLRCVSSVTGKDMHEFAEQWIHSGGHADFLVEFSFNRKRNVIELQVKQEPQKKGVMKYIGPVNLTLQELDGSFNYTFQIDDTVEIEK